MTPPPSWRGVRFLIPGFDVPSPADPSMPGATPEETEAVFKVWNTMHDEMAALSTRGVNRVVPGASHYIQYEQPAVVIAAVQEVLEAVRSKRRA